MASINDLNTRLTSAKGIKVYKNTGTTAIASGTYFAIQFLNDGAYNFTIDGDAYTAITVSGGVVLYGDITSILCNDDASDAIALYKN